MPPSIVELNLFKKARTVKRESSAARSRIARHHSLRPQRRQNCAKDGCVVPHARHKRLYDRAMSFRDEEVTIRTTTTISTITTNVGTPITHTPCLCLHYPSIVRVAREGYYNFCLIYHSFCRRPLSLVICRWSLVIRDLSFRERNCHPEVLRRIWPLARKARSFGVPQDDKRRALSDINE